MKRFFKFRVFGFFVIAVIIAAVTLIAVNTRGNPGIFTNTLTSLSKPFRTVAVSVVKTFESFYGYIYKYDTVQDENERLNDEIARLQKEYRDYIDVSNENERLRELLNLKDRYPGTSSLIRRPLSVGTRPSGYRLLRSIRAPTTPTSRLATASSPSTAI